MDKPGAARPSPTPSNWNITRKVGARFACAEKDTPTSQQSHLDVYVTFTHAAQHSVLLQTERGPVGELPAVKESELD